MVFNNENKDCKDNCLCEVVKCLAKNCTGPTGPTGPTARCNKSSIYFFKW